LNFDQHLRCNFGSKSVVAHYVDQGYITCRAPMSQVVNKPIPFTVSLNKQQNSRERVDYWYYNAPTISRLIPNYGPDTGGNTVLIKGGNIHPFNETIDIDNSNDTFCDFQGIGKTPLKAINSTKAQCVVPPNTPGYDFVYLEITLNDQNYTDDSVPYFYYRPPKIYDI